MLRRPLEVRLRNVLVGMGIPAAGPHPTYLQGFQGNLEQYSGNTPIIELIYLCKAPCSEVRYQVVVQTVHYK